MSRSIMSSFTSIRKQIVKRGPNSTGINFYKEEIPFDKVGQWIELQVPSDFATIMPSHDEKIIKDIEKDNDAYLKVRRQIYQNVLYWLVGNKRRRPDLITAENVQMFILIRDKMSELYTSIEQKLSTTLDELNKQFDAFDIIYSEKKGYVKTSKLVDNFETTIYINQKQEEEYLKLFDEMKVAIQQKRAINDHILNQLLTVYPTVDKIILEAVIEDFKEDNLYTTKSLLDEHSKTILDSITKRK